MTREKHTPDQLAGFRVGDAVRLPGVDCTLKVIGLAEPHLILQSPAGHQLRADWSAVVPVESSVKNSRTYGSSDWSARRR